MAKRKTPPTTAAGSTSSSVKNLRLYQKSYKGGGTKDSHFVVFQQANSFITGGADKVLYPGCHRHLTASLLFPSVTYVDCDSKVGPLFEEPAAKEFVETHKIYDQDCHYEFLCENVCTTTPLQGLAKDYDLLISLSAGLLSGPCTTYVREGGWLLVNDSHSDARSIFVGYSIKGSNEEKKEEGWNWQLKAYWDNEEGKFASDQEHLQKCFQAVDNKSKQEAPLSKEQVDESIAVGAISKRSFVVPFAPMFYLFQLQQKKNQMKKGK